MPFEVLWEHLNDKTTLIPHLELNKDIHLIKKYDVAAIRLIMDDEGIPIGVEKRVAVEEKILEHAANLVIPIEDVVIDPLVMAVGADHTAGIVMLQSIERIVSFQNLWDKIG